MKKKDKKPTPSQKEKDCEIFQPLHIVAKFTDRESMVAALMLSVAIDLIGMSAKPVFTRDEVCKALLTIGSLELPAELMTAIRLLQAK